MELAIERTPRRVLGRSWSLTLNEYASSLMSQRSPRVRSIASSASMSRSWTLGESFSGGSCAKMHSLFATNLVSSKPMFDSGVMSDLPSAAASSAESQEVRRSST